MKKLRRSHLRRMRLRWFAGPRSRPGSFLPKVAARCQVGRSDRQRLIEVIQLQRDLAGYSTSAALVVDDHKSANRSGCDSVGLVNVWALSPIRGHDHLIHIAGNVKGLVEARLSDEESRNLRC